MSKADTKHRTRSLVLARDGAPFFEVAVPEGAPLKIEVDKDTGVATLNIESAEDDGVFAAGGVPEAEPVRDNSNRRSTASR